MSLDSVLGHTATTTGADLSILASLLDDTALARAARALPPTRGSLTPTRGGLAPWQVLRVKTHVETHLDSTVRARDLAAMVRLSTGHFCRAFKRSLGVAPLAYIAGRRVARAQNLMLATNEPLSQIALVCGFYDQAHLTRVFRRHAGTSPHDWRRRHRSDAAPVVAPRAREHRHPFSIAVADKNAQRSTSPHARYPTTFA
jgi:transcriptional regulator GlxA family with amidase domain